MLNGDLGTLVQDYHFEKIPGTRGHERSLFGPVMPEEGDEVLVPENEGIVGSLERFYCHDYSGMLPFSGILHDLGGVALALFAGASRRVGALPALALATGVAFVPEAVNWSYGHLESSQVPLQAGMDVGKVALGYFAGRFIGARRNETCVGDVINYETRSRGWKPKWWPKG